MMVLFIVLLAWLVHISNQPLEKRGSDPPIHFYLIRVTQELVKSKPHMTGICMDN